MLPYFLLHLQRWRAEEPEQVLLGCPGSGGGGVPATVHVLVHLLGNLLSMAEVGSGDGDPVEDSLDLSRVSVRAVWAELQLRTPTAS